MSVPTGSQYLDPINADRRINGGRERTVIRFPAFPEHIKCRLRGQYSCATALLHG